MDVAASDKEAIELICSRTIMCKDFLKFSSIYKVIIIGLIFKDNEALKKYIDWIRSVYTKLDKVLVKKGLPSVKQPIICTLHLVISTEEKSKAKISGSDYPL